MNSVRYKISINGQDCDNISDKLLKQVQALIEENEDIVLSFEEIFEKIACYIIDWYAQNIYPGRCRGSLEISIT